MKWCLDEVLRALNGLETQVPNAQVLSFLLLSLLHLISYRLKIVFSPRYTRLAPFLPWVTKLVSLFLINLPHQTLCLCGKLKHLQEQVKVSTIVRFTWHFCICGGKRGKEKVEKWALMQEPASTTWWSIGGGTCMEVVRNLGDSRRSQRRS